MSRSIRVVVHCKSYLAESSSKRIWTFLPLGVLVVRRWRPYLYSQFGALRDSSRVVGWVGVGVTFVFLILGGVVGVNGLVIVVGGFVESVGVIVDS